MLKQFEVRPFKIGMLLDLCGYKSASGHDNLKPLTEILESLKRCKSVIVENDYIDKDYRAEFSDFYSKTFKVYQQRCLRLHFFSCQIKPDSLASLKLPPASAYIGNLVVRPTAFHRVGRTLITPKHILKTPGKHFIKCHANYTAHILGYKYITRAMPFIQQDTQVASCAEACVWMLGRYMSKVFNSKEFLPPEINRLAQQLETRGRINPATGLTVSQMIHVLYQMGYFVNCYERASYTLPEKPPSDANRQLAEHAYFYIESGLPVLLTSVKHQHAVIGIGHSYSRRPLGARVLKRIPEFIVHDDASGPYRRMPIDLPSAKPETLSFCDVDYVIAVLPEKVYLEPHRAHSTAQDAVSDIITNIGMDHLQLIGTYAPPFEYRTYLMKATIFQGELLAAFKSSSANSQKRLLIKRLLSISLPNYIWVTEVLVPGLLNQSADRNRCRIGLVISDSTAPAQSTLPIIALHLGRCLLLYSHGETSGPGGELINLDRITPFGYRTRHGFATRSQHSV